MANPAKKARLCRAEGTQQALKSVNIAVKKSQDTFENTEHTL